MVDSKIKGEVNKFTNSTSYEFGDLTKEIVRRVATGKYTLDDLFILFKALAMIGASLSPVGKYIMCMSSYECLWMHENMLIAQQLIHHLFFPT